MKSWSNRPERRVIRAGGLGGLMIAGIVGAVLVQGCGRQGGESPQTESRLVTTPPEPAQNAVAVPAAAFEAPRGALMETKPGAEEAMPPDVEIAPMDTLVTPGEAIEVRVHGTSDVTRMTLSDGMNDPQALVRDSATNVWRVNYRVPLRPRQERWGVSVTAKNDANRWRRVWVFLHAEGVGHEEKVKPDSTSASGQ